MWYKVVALKNLESKIVITTQTAIVLATSGSCGFHWYQIWAYMLSGDFYDHVNAFYKSE